MAANMDGVGTFSMSKALMKHSMFTCITKQHSVDEWIKNIDDLWLDMVAISIGTSLEAYEETSKIIGPGSVCTTRIQTGVGYPQLSAVIECADAAHGLGGHVIADGGCTCPGDVAKAFAAGADFVMLGGMFAGHTEGGGEITTKIFKTGEYHASEYGDRLGPVYDEKHYITFYGMSSDTAMNKHSGGVASYRSSEGRTVDVPFKGPIDSTINDILGGLRSTCTYVGAPTLKQLSKCTTFVRCTQQFKSVFI